MCLRRSRSPISPRPAPRPTPHASQLQSPLVLEAVMRDAEIRELPGLIGQKVGVHGWLYNSRSSGKLRFLVVRDGSGYLQSVVFKPGVAERVWDDAGSVTQESLAVGHRQGQGGPALPGRRRARGRRPRHRLSSCPEYPITAQGARPRLPAQQPPPVAALEAPARRHAGAQRAHLRHPRLLLPAATSSTSTRRSSPRRRARAPRRCSRPTTSARRRTSRSRASSTSSRRRRRTARCTASGPRSAPRSPRPAATSWSSGWSSPRSRGCASRGCWTSPRSSSP